MKTEIEKYNPCIQAIEFRNQFNSFKEAWDNCPRSDWMLWIAQKVDVDIRTLTKAKALCAKTVINLMKDKRSINAVEIALKFSEGKATLDELDTAAKAAAKAANAADTDANANTTSYIAKAAAYAANAAANATAYTVYTAANTPAYAAYAANAAANTPYAAAYTVRVNNQKQTADICRNILTDTVLKLIKN